MLRVSRLREEAAEAFHDEEVDDSLGPAIEPPWEAWAVAVDGGDEAIELREGTELEAAGWIDFAGEETSGDVVGTSIHAGSGEGRWRELKERPLF